MDLYQLDCFRTVARMEHISKAAQVLHVTQPALSKIVSRVEDYAGAPLFDRVKGKIYLNAAGMSFLKTLDQMFDMLDKGKRDVKEISDRENNYIRLASSCDSILFMLAEDFFSKHPDTRVRYSVLTPKEIQTAFLENRLDFALTTSPIQGQWIEWQPIAEEEIIMLVGENSPFYDRKSVSVSELKGVEIMCENSGGELREKITSCFESVGFSPNIVFESNSGSVMGFTMGMSRAVCFVPAHRFMQMEEAHSGGEGSPEKPRLHGVRLEMPRCTWTTGLAKRPDNVMNDASIAFYELTLEYFKNLNSKMSKFFDDYFGVESI